MPRSVLSRVADSIYWLSRYVERAENVARFIDVNVNLMLDLPGEIADQWQPLVDITGDTRVFAERYEVASQRNVVHFLTFDPQNPNSVLSCVRAATPNITATMPSSRWLYGVRNSGAKCCISTFWIAL